ncbi:hypothetical protein LTR80_011961, partial [Exophiala xenobiotica]
EASSNRVELKDDDPATSTRMVSYMYTFDYKDEIDQNPDPDDPSLEEVEEAVEIISAKSDTISNHDQDQPALFSSVRVYAIADKYDIPPLKELARQRFGNWAKTNWLHEDFCNVAREVFDSTPANDRGLRDVVIQIVALHVNDLTEKPEFRNLIEEIGDLGLGILRQVLKQNSAEVSDLDSRVKDLEAETEILKGQVKDRDKSYSARPAIQSRW